MPLEATQLDRLPYHDRLHPRAATDIDLVVVHCTELPDLTTARRYGERVMYEDTGTGNSGHFYIDRDGSVHAWVTIDHVAHHTRGYNERSIGIELVNRGRYPDWHDSRRQAMDEPYADAQIDALIELLQALHEGLPCLHHIAGHEDLDTEEIVASDDPGKRVRRKRDPGPLFPWTRIAAETALTRIPA